MGYGAGKIKKNGIINGGIIGLIYILLVYLLSSLTGSGFSLSIYSILMIVCGIVAGAIGGVVRSKPILKTVFEELIQCEN